MGLPWSHLEQLIEDVHVREVAFGTGYIVTGQAPPPPVLAGDPAGSGRRSTWAVSGRHAQHAGAAGLDRAARLELQDIVPGAAADYLTRTQRDCPPDGWQELISRLPQDLGSSLAQAPSNPLMLTLVRDTYRAGDNAGELLGLRDAVGHPASGEDIASHLLDRVLPAAHTQQPGEPPPRYELPTAERALRRIATRMNNDGTRDLQWWHVPAWAPAAPRVMASWLGAVLVAGLASGHTDGLLAGNTAGFWAVFAFGRGNKPPKRIAPVRWRQLFRRRPLGGGPPRRARGRRPGRPRGRARARARVYAVVVILPRVCTARHLTGLRFASCGSSKTPAAAASCARSGPSNSSATPAGKTAWPSRNRGLPG